MARPNYGPQAHKRARLLFEVLLSFANDEIEDGDVLYAKIKTNWQNNQQLVIRTKIRYLVNLTEKAPQPSSLNATQIKEALKRFDDHLEILDDHRTSTQGSDNWHFTLYLAHPRYEILKNLQTFDQEWQTRRPLKSKQATAALEETDAQADVQRTLTPGELAPPEQQPASPSKQQDWGQAIDVSRFYGREVELQQLQQWVVQDRCRFISLLGMGGIGKTSLSVKLAEQCQDAFEFLVWRSLRNAPPVMELLAELIRFLSAQQVTALPELLDQRIRLLMQLLQDAPSLVVLDNFESLLSPAADSGLSSGHYRQGYEGYGALLRSLSESPHPSCIVLTSREKPQDISKGEGSEGPIRSLLLSGLQQSEGQAILKDKGIELSAAQTDSLIQQYGGNPLALQIVATAVQELFEGNIEQFLEQGSTVFGDISDLLAQQVGRLSALEQQVMYWLAIYRDWTTMQALQEDVKPAVPQRMILEALSSLQRRSLLEKRRGQFTQQPVVMEYITECLIDGASAELLGQPDTAPPSPGQSDFLNRYALTLAQTKDYLRQAQVQLILQPIAERLTLRWGPPRRVIQRLEHQLKELKSEAGLLPEPGYAASNLLKLLHHLGADLADYDCSELSIWQMYLQEMDLHGVNFSHADFDKTVFAQITKRFISATFSPDSQCLATGVDNDIILWQIKDCNPVRTLTGHVDLVRTLAFTPDGKILASGSGDQTIRLWDVTTGQCLKTIRGHQAAVQSIAVSLDGERLVSGGDRSLYCWSIPDGALLQQLEGHTAAIQSVAFYPDGQQVLSSSQDGMVRVWNLETETCTEMIEAKVNWSLACDLSPDGQRFVAAIDNEAVQVWDWAELAEPIRLDEQSQVWATCFSPDGRRIATASEDRTVQLWDAITGDRLQTLQGHSDRVWLACFSPDGRYLASASDDQTLKLWDGETGERLSTLKTYKNAVMAIALSPKGNWLASGSEDGKIRLWERETYRCIKTLSGHDNVVGALQFGVVDTKLLLLSGSDDGTVQLWDGESGRCLRVFYGHGGWVPTVAFDPLGRFLASGSHDGTVKLWDRVSGECLRTLEVGGRVKAIAISPDGQWLASGGDDAVIELWDLERGDSVRQLKGHDGRVLSLQFSPEENGKVYRLASGSEDKTVRLWDVAQGKCLSNYTGHEGAVRSVVFTANGKHLVSGGADTVLRLWDGSTGNSLGQFAGHEKTVWEVVCQEEVVISSSDDGTMRLWELETGDCSAVISPPRPYEGMEITEALGLTEAQREALLALGAVEQV